MENMSKITLREDEKEYLESIVRSRTSPAQMVQRAKVLLLKDKNVPIAIISDIVGLKRTKVNFYLRKYKEGGAKYAVCDAPKRNGINGYTDEEKNWIINLVCQEPNNIRFSEEIWSFIRLTKYINEKAEEAGYPRLSAISYTSVITILKQAGIDSRSLRYSAHLQRRYPDASNFY